MALLSAPRSQNANDSKDRQHSDLRAELKRQYYRREEAYFGDDMKYYWQSESRMLKLVNLAPVVSTDRGLQLLCNKSTILYWALSAQKPDVVACSGIVFACIYKAWFRCHDNRPDIDFGKFFAQPFQITATGPQTIQEILKTHAHLCDQAVSQLNGIKGGEFGHGPEERRNWRNYQLLPTCRALIVLFDERVPPPERRIDGTISLDAEAQRRSVVLILTGYHEGLSEPISFNGIRSDSLPLARDDTSAINSAKIIRVPMNIAVQFIAELQRREEEAMLASQQDTTGTPAIDKAEEWVNKILDNPSESDLKQFAIENALSTIDMRKRGEIPDEEEFNHWRGDWV